MISPKTGARRLRVLANFLEKKVPDDRFSYVSWSTGADGRMHNVKRSHLSLGKGCGTMGCALGWAPSVPSLRKAGFRLRQGVPTLRDEQPATESDPIAAAEAVFGLTYDQADAVFTGVPYRDVLDFAPLSSSKETVIARIRKMAAHLEKKKKGK